jgi:DNA mismatch endonuclease, patch repair protein
MKANRRCDTNPELELRSALHRRGHRFRKDHPVRLPERVVRPDVVFTRLRTVVFVDGCFWHGCPRHGTMPRRNRWYWSPKIRRNRRRDVEVTKMLRRSGWRVIRVWEHTTADVAAGRVAAQLLRARVDVE